MIRLLPLSLLLVLAGCSDGAKTGDDTAGGSDTTTTGDDTAVATQNDKDADTILDITEGQDDPDADGKPNDDDRDADGDTIRDIIEAGDQDINTLPFDSDADGTPDYLDLDSDANCVPDSVEAGRSDGGANDTDGDGVRDYADTDNDNDGILDTIEIGAACDGTLDSDSDGTPDHLDTDSDNDGIADVYESGVSAFNATPRDADGDGVPDYLDTDSDNDGLPDSDEGGTGGNLSVPPRDTDADGLPDSSDADSDGDGLSDDSEITLGTDPYDADTDGDGYSDGGEVTAGADPLDPTSVIDGIYVIVPERTTVEQGFDFELLLERGDIAFVADTTGSMGGTIRSLATEFSTLISDLTTVLPDAAYGIAAHDDYAFGSYGSAGSDKPFWLGQQVTTDTSLALAALTGIHLGSGGDGPEGSMEGIYQAATGAGYDQNCDGRYDASTDMLPFIASAGDPFGGTAGEGYDASTPGTGDGGGMGFREYSLPVIVLATDNYMRDPESTNRSYNGTPGGCPIDAGNSDVVNAFLANGIRFIGVSVNGSLPYPQMVTLATMTNSLADLDGDGVANEPVVETWNTSSAEFRTTMATAIQQLVAGIRFSRVDLSVDGDPYGFVTSIDPSYYEGLGTDDSGEILTFNLTFRGVVAATTSDQTFLLTLNVLGDSTILVAQKQILVVVPGTNF